VAKELGIAKSTLYLRIKRYGINREAGEAGSSTSG